MGNASSTPNRAPRPDASDLRLVFPAEAAAIREALQTATDALGGWNIGAEIVGEVEIVLAEVLNNIAEHAFRDRPDSRIELDIARVPGALDIRIRDDGRPMPGGEAPVGTPQDIDVATADLPEGGFGWFLIRELTADLVYRRQAGHNELTLRVPLAARTAGA